MNSAAEVTPMIVRDTKTFDGLVNMWKFAGVWDSFDLVYENLSDVPERLGGFAIVASNDRSEKYGLLMKVTPKQASNTTFTQQKLLAKVRLS